MPRGTYLLAIDLGTSGCKAALVSVHGRVVAWCPHALETRILPGVYDRAAIGVETPRCSACAKSTPGGSGLGSAALDWLREEHSGLSGDVKAGSTPY
jgi:hypothetical protein